MPRMPRITDIAFALIQQYKHCLDYFYNFGSLESINKLTIIPEYSKILPMLQLVYITQKL